MSSECTLSTDVMSKWWWSNGSDGAETIDERNPCGADPIFELFLLLLLVLIDFRPRTLRLFDDQFFLLIEELMSLLLVAYEDWEDPIFQYGFEAIGYVWHWMVGWIVFVSDRYRTVQVRSENF